MAITIPQSDRFVTYTATAGQTTFGYDFPIYEDSDLAVYQITAGVITKLTLTTNYTVTGAGVQAGGNVVLVVGAALDDNIVISGDLPELRSTNYSGAGDFTKESVNTELNKEIQLDQQLRRDVDRSIHLDPADITDVSSVNFELPLTDDRKGKFLYFTSDDGSVAVNENGGISGPTSSADKEVVLFNGIDGKSIKRPGTDYMIIPQGTDAQRGTPSNIVMRGNTTGDEDVEFYVNGGWVPILTGGTGAPINSTYITRTPSGTLTDEQAMSALGTGIVKNETGTGVQSIAVDGTDYITAVLFDPSPHLGSHLDVNGKNIVSTANGDITISPDGTGETNITSPIQFTPQTAPAYAEGKLYYSSLNKTLSMYNIEPDLELQIGQENWIRVYNDSGAQIDNGAVVYASGKEDAEDRLTIALAQANIENTSRVIGTATHDIGNNEFGFITQFGYVGDVDTSAFADGDTIFLSPTVGGGYTTTEPTSPNVSVFLGFVVDAGVSGNLFMTTIANTSGVGVAGDATQLVESARKDTVGDIDPGEVVYVAGYNVGLDVVTVELAKSDSAATMSGLGVVSSGLTNVVTGTVVSSGRVAGIDTSGFNVGDDLYVSSDIAGELTNVKPTDTNFIQKVGIVLRSHATQGVIIVVGAGRSNDNPNFSAADKYWYGGVTGTATEGDITDITAYDFNFIAGYTSLMGPENLTVRTYSEMAIVRSFTITGEQGYLATPTTDTACIVDIEKNGTTVYATKPQFNVATALLTPGILKTDGTEDFDDGDRLTFKVTQIGLITPGAEMRFAVKGQVNV